jgi:DNA-binding transcriptional regulator/RsmH inhibitor MraZ
LKIFRARARRARTQHRTRREHHTRLEERAFTRWTRAGASSRGHDHRSRVGVCGAARRARRLDRERFLVSFISRRRFI